MADRLAGVVRHTTAAMSRFLIVASLLVFTIGVPLILAPERTADLFAWTIQAPVTTAFLGAAYWASGIAELVSAREPVWANARVTVAPVFVFTTLTLVITLFHIDRFHLGADQPLAARTVATVWLAVYAAVPVILAWVWWRQLREPGGDPPRAFPLPRWARGPLVVHAALMLTVGVALVLAPESVAPAWPWPLTALTGRAIGAWAIGLGLGAALGAWENDWRRLKAASAAYAAFGALGLLALVRFAGSIAWSSAGAWILVVVLGSLLVGGIAAWRAGVQASS
jgi:hypothetical protein